MADESFREKERTYNQAALAVVFHASFVADRELRESLDAHVSAVHRAYWARDQESFDAAADVFVPPYRNLQDRIGALVVQYSRQQESNRWRWWRRMTGGR